MEVSPIVQEYRDTLDKYGITWEDGSEDSDWITWERTRVNLGGEKQLSVVYGYSRKFDCGYSYGYPTYLEAWILDSKEDPIAMTIPEIMEKYFHVEED